MPKATIYKYNSLIFRQDNIGFSRKSFVVFSISESLMKKIFSNHFFRFSIFTADMRHIKTSFFWRFRIHFYASHLRCFTTVIDAFTGKFDIRNPDFSPVPSFFLISGNLIHRENCFIYVLITQLTIRL